MSNNYNFRDVENTLLSCLNLQEQYKSNPESHKEAFVTIMPPPNITGNLHIGHALVLTLQDILTRYHRMKGYDTLWQAGVDHAGIATQLVVERQLNEKGLKKEDLGYEGFIQEVLQWKVKAQTNIINQIKKIGASCDFSNIAFTFSPEFNLAVNKVFVLLYEEGLIYQDYKLVNWDTKFATAISDLEVNVKEEKGKLYYIEYNIKETSEKIIIATTRPETMFGDVAIAVNPKDTRYQTLIGKTAYIPIINRAIPIIADEYSIINKGSGAVKITPAHDFNDFEVGKRHNLPLIIIMDHNGKLNDNVPKEFRHLNVQEARNKIVNSLHAAGNLVKVEEHIINVPYGDRSNTVIEPLPSKQWFLDVNEMSKAAIEAVKNKEVVLIPNTWQNLYFEWLNNIKSWCISRQLWWGHKIPVWYSEEGKIFVANNKDEALEKAKKFYCKDNIKLTQDSSVLDTWFSSALWPFVTLGWPNMESKRLKKYYPTSTLVTGFDIIFFWVARMIMLGKHILKDVPFKKVYLHSLILDSKGQKMSKTKGNVVDPLLLMDKYGTDAFRFTLTSYSSNAQNIKFSEKHLDSSKNFVTKVWNIYRFLTYYKCYLDNNFNFSNVNICLNQWIILKLQNLLDEIHKYIDNYQFNEVANKIYHFVWDIYCDWYIEIVKIVLTNQEYSNIKEETSKTAIYIFNMILHIMHPIMPFITQYLYQLINNENNKLLTNECYPSNIIDNKQKKIFQKNNIEFILEIIYKIRSIRSSLKVPSGLFIDLYIVISSNDQIINLVQNSTTIIKKLAKIKDLFIVNDLSTKDLFVEVINNNIIIGLEIKNIIDTKLEIQRLTNEKMKVEKELNQLNQKLSNTDFLHKAPLEVVNSFKAQQKNLNNKLSLIQSTILKLN